MITIPSTVAVAADDLTSDEIPGRIRGRDLRHWRGVLESLWRQKLDQAIVLARACAEVAIDAGQDVGGAAPPYERLRSRTERAYDVLSEIEAAIARVDAGSYGICAGCGRLMDDDWLADQPEVQRCRCCESRRSSSPACDASASAPRPSPDRLVPAARARVLAG